jgi:hypothetical protein
MTIELSPGMMTEEEFFEHAGIKGMKWGVRKEKMPGLSSGGKAPKPELSEAELASRRKKRIAGALAVGIVLAAAGAIYVVHDQAALSKINEFSKLGGETVARAQANASSDSIVTKGAEFTRRSYLTNGAWENEIRTYALEGGDSDLIGRYGNKVFKFKASKDVKIAGLTSQLDILNDSKVTGELRKLAANEHAKYSISGRRAINKMMSNDEFSKMTLGSLRKDVWDGMETGSPSTKAYAQILKDRGYAAVRDLNLPDTSARVLLDRNAFVNA